MIKDQNDNFSKKFRKLLSLHNLYNKIKSIYFAIIPKGSKVYKFTHNLLSIFLKKIHFFNITYQEWIRRVDTLNEEKINKIRKMIENMTSKPCISIIMPVYNTPDILLEEAIQSVLDQIYPHWELCIADDASTKPNIKHLLQQYQEKDPRIRVVFREQNGHISLASNSALELAKYPFVALLDHDDVLHPLALYYVAKTINEYPDSEIIFTDEDKITLKGRRLDPYFKPDFNYELLLSQNMVSHLGVYRTSTMRAVEGFRKGFEGSQDYDLLLRIIDRIEFHQIHHIPLPLYHWRISKQSVAVNVNVKPYAIDSGMKALSEHLERRSIDAKINFLPDVAAYQVVYNLPAPEPAVAIFIQDDIISDILINCIDSIINNTNYVNYAIYITTPQMTNDAKLAYDNRWGERVKFIHSTPTSKIFSYANSLNELIPQLSEDFFVFLDKRIWVTSSEWLKNLVGQANQVNIGAVSPKLLNHKKIIYSSGSVLLPDGSIHQISRGEKIEVNGYFGWSRITRGYSILPEKCLVVKRDHYNAVGGFKDSFKSRVYQIADFCLELKSMGLRNIEYPSVELYFQDIPHYNLKEKEFNQKIVSERDQFIKDWKTWIAKDPAFNPNLEIIDDGKLSINLSPKFTFPGKIIDENIQ